MNTHLGAVPPAPKWRLICHLNFGRKGHEMHYADPDLGVSLIKSTPKLKGGGWGKPKMEFCDEHSKRRFASGAELMEAVAARTCEKCGCTEFRACIALDGTPCSWVRVGLCTACAKEGA